VGSGFGALRATLRAFLTGFLAAARFAGFLAFLALARFFEPLAAGFRVFFATAFLAFRFAFFAIVFSLEEIQPVQTLPPMALLPIGPGGYSRRARHQGRSRRNKA
jgi:hypothetical protein